MSHERLERLLERARQTNASRDAVDRQYGAATPREGGAWGLLTCGVDAVRAGLATGDWDCVAEGFLMLEEITERFRPAVIEVRP